MGSSRHHVTPVYVYPTDQMVPGGTRILQFAIMAIKTRFRELSAQVRRFLKLTMSSLFLNIVTFDDTLVLTLYGPLPRRVSAEFRFTR